jgi:hypothetical protein
LEHRNQISGNGCEVKSLCKQLASPSAKHCRSASVMPAAVSSFTSHAPAAATSAEMFTGSAIKQFGSGVAAIGDQLLQLVLPFYLIGPGNHQLQLGSIHATAAKASISRSTPFLG